MIENSSVNREFLGNKTGKNTTWVYLLSIPEIVNSAQQIGTGALLTVNSYMLDLIWGISSIYVFDLRGEGENGNLSSSSTAVILKFDTLRPFENYITSVIACLLNYFVLSIAIYKS